jgi:hypothetical protein
MERPDTLERLSGPEIELDASGQVDTPVAVTRFPYHGWPGCYLISNSAVEAVVVPAIGRVMQFRLPHRPGGAIWENRALDGQLHPPICNKWVNFGGDKCWPTPQSAWKQHEGSDWPPPAAFDSSPVRAHLIERGVSLTSIADPGYGIQVVRHVELDAKLPVMRIRTEYRKITGKPVKIGVWSITQMKDPERVYVLLPVKLPMTACYIPLMGTRPAGIRIEGRLLSLMRDTQGPTKIGTSGSSLLWVGKDCMVRIDAEAGPGDYPDGGCVTEVYTNSDPLKYVELETLGPLATIEIGETIQRTTVYTAMQRLLADPDADANRVFANDL